MDQNIESFDNCPRIRWMTWDFAFHIQSWAETKPLRVAFPCHQPTSIIASYYGSFPIPCSSYGVRNTCLSDEHCPVTNSLSSNSLIIIDGFLKILKSPT